MANVRQIRKIQPSRTGDFDEQLWPVNIALVVLCGFVAGIIVALSDFHTPRLLHNGWFHLATLTITMGLLLVVAIRLGGKIGRRLQLAALLSLLLHVVLGLQLYIANMQSKLAMEEGPEDAPIREEDSISKDHLVMSKEQPRALEHEQVVDVESPEAEPEEIAQQKTVEDSPPQDTKPTPVPELTTEIEPTPVKRPEMAQAAPRRADETSKLSRQTASVPQPQQVTAPDAEVAPPQAAPQMQAAATSVQRQAADVRAAQGADQQVPSTIEPSTTAQPARRTAEAQPVAAAAGTPTLTRQVNQPTEIPRSAVAAPDATAVASAPAYEVTPSTTATRQQTASPQAAKPTVEAPMAAPSVAQAAPATRQSAAESRPQLAQNPQPAAARATQDAALPANTTVDSPSAPMTPATEQTAALAPSTTQVARTTTAPASQTSSTSEAAISPAAAVAGATLDRRETSSTPSIQPSAAPSDQVARAQKSALTLASPMNVESPALVQSTEPSPAQQEPSRTAISKATGGIAGVGRTENFDRGIPATRSPAATASVSARRDAASQEGPSGPALSPSAPARIARSTAGADAPSSTVAAVDVPTGDIAGAQETGQLDASASAAVARNDAAAPQGNITAAKGDADVDIGPTQVVAATGTGRASGGGQPEPAMSSQGQQIARTPSGGSAVAAIATDVTAESPEAPAADGGGQPAMPAASAVAVSTERTQAGGGPPASATPSPATGAELSGSGVGQPGAAQIGRTVASDAVSGAPSVGGGTGQIARAGGQTMATNAQAELPTLASDAPAEGAPGGVPASAPQTEVSRQVAGMAGQPVNRPVGAAAGDTAIDIATVGQPGAGRGPTGKAESGGEGPSVTDTAGGAALPRATRAGVPGAAGEPIDVPELPGSAAAGQPEADVVAMGTESGPARATRGAVPVDIQAAEGPGGLGDRITLDVGSPSRNAQRDSDEVHLADSRFLQRKSGGPLAVDGRIRDAAPAFGGRGLGERGKQGGAGRPPARTEQSVELGLEFLARHRLPDGSWSLDNFPGATANDRGTYHSDTAATGLALLAFLGAGYDHFDDKYKQVVQGGIDFLIKNQQPNGDLYVAQDAKSTEHARYYSHGIAAIALCEALGMTGDEKLREPAQKAMQFIIDSQHPDLGGWRYSPQQSSDTSVSGWQLMALKSGELAGLQVPPQVYEKVTGWLDQAQKEGGSQYAYDPKASLQDYVDAATGNRMTRSHHVQASNSMTAAGLLMRLYLGWNREHPEMIEGAEHLARNLADDRAAKRDTYYWYYATQVMYHMHGKYWKKWNDKLHPMLVGSQIKTGRLAGSWDPRRPVPDLWGVHGGRIYVTAMNILSLEVTYRHLPIYESTAK